MKVGIGSWTYGWAVGVEGYPRPDPPLSHLGLLGKAVALGVEVVQFADNLPVEGLGEADREQLRAAAREHGITLELGTRGLAPPHLLRYLELCQYFGATLLRTLPPAGRVLGSLRAQIEAVLSEYARAGVAIALENYEGHRAAELASFIESIDSPFLGVCLDTVNSLGALEGPEEVVRTLAPYVLNVHVKDFEIVRAPSRMGFLVEGRAAGEGRLNIPWLLEQTRRHGHDPNAIIELWTPYCGSIEATTALEDQWARASVDYLKRHV
jgi:sugar phosphate isomerase/epimerase